MQSCLVFSNCPMNMQGEWSSYQGGTPSTTFNPTMSKEFYLDDVKGHICITRRITIPPFQTANVHGKMDVWGYGMWIPCAGRFNVDSPAAHIHCANHYIWRSATMFLLSASLSEEPECLAYHDYHKVHGLKSHQCQPDATGNPPWKLKESQAMIPGRVDPG